MNVSSRFGPPKGVSVNNPLRKRNALATRGSILDAAHRLFAMESYDDVGVRDIARNAGVDPALISRYFGCKEDLYSEVLDQNSGAELVEGDRRTFGARIAAELIDGVDQCRLEGLLVLVRSIASSRALEVVRRSANARFYGPFADWLDGTDGAVRARLAAGVIMGMAITRELTCGFGLDPEATERLRQRLAQTLQAFIDE